MEEFNAGDVCEIIHWDRRSDLIGHECIIVERTQADDQILRLVLEVDPSDYLAVVIEGAPETYDTILGSVHALALPEHLRKKQPPDDEASWERIEELTGWKPVTGKSSRPKELKVK